MEHYPPECCRVGEMKLIKDHRTNQRGWIPPEDVINVILEGEDAGPDRFFNRDARANAQAGFMLFNLTGDSEERNNLADRMPDVVKDLAQKLDEV